MVVVRESLPSWRSAWAAEGGRPHLGLAIHPILAIHPDVGLHRANS